MQKQTAPTNIKELRDSLLEAYNSLRLDPKRYNQVGEQANTAGKIIASLKLELEYAQLRGEVPQIDFLDYGQLKVDAPRTIKELKAAAG